MMVILVDQTGNLLAQGVILALERAPITGNRFTVIIKSQRGGVDVRVIPGRRFAAHIHLPNREHVAHGAQQPGFDPNGGGQQRQQPLGAGVRLRAFR